MLLRDMLINSWILAYLTFELSVYAHVQTTLTWIGKRKQVSTQMGQTGNNLLVCSLNHPTNQSQTTLRKVFEANKHGCNIKQPEFHCWDCQHILAKQIIEGLEHRWFGVENHGKSHLIKLETSPITSRVYFKKTSEGATRPVVLIKVGDGFWSHFQKISTLSGRLSQCILQSYGP